MKLFPSTYKAIMLLLIPWMSFVSRAQDPQWEWYKELSTGGDEFITAVAVDPSDNSVYAGGNWSTNLSAIFPDGTYAHNRFNSTYGAEDGFLVKYDSAGNYLWGFRLGGVNADRVNSLSVDNEGSVYITGFFGQGTGYFYGTSAPAGAAQLTNSNYEDFFLAKYDASGAFQWIRRSDSNAGDVEGWDLCTNSSSVFAIGVYQQEADFGPLTTHEDPDDNDVFLVCYDRDGVERWITTAGSNDNEFGESVVADDAAVYCTGWFDGSNLNVRDRDGNSLLIMGNEDDGTSEIFLLSYDTDGWFRWGQRIHSEEIDRGRGLCMDSDSLYLTGTIDDDTDFPGYSGNPVPTSDNRDIFLSSHSKSDGLTGWVLVFPCSGSGNEKGRNLDMTPENHLVVIGEYRNNLTFPGGPTVSSSGSDEVFLAGYTTGGEFLWGLGLGSSGDEDGNAIAVGTQGTFYAGGLYDNNMNAGPFLLGNDSGDNGFLFKLNETFAPPVNDDPCAALLLPVADTCASQTHDNLGATDSGIPDPGCGSYAGGDVWFKAVVPPSGNLFVGTQTTNDDVYPPLDGYMWSLAVALYSGDCGTLSLQACYESNSAYNSRASSAYLFDQVPGDTIWIRVWESSGDHNGRFAICSYDPGHFPGWDLADNICEENGPIDLDTTLSPLKSGFADMGLVAIGIPDPGNALGAPDGNSATFDDLGDRLVVDLTDTIPVGEPFVLHMRSNPLVSGESSMVLRTSLDNIIYQDHSFQPEISADIYDSYFIIAEYPTRFLWIENNGGGGGFRFDGAEYYFRGTRGGTWSGPGVTGSIFDPAGLSGAVSIMYSAGGTSTRTDSIRTILILESDAGTLGNDTTVCSAGHDLQLDLTGYTGSVIAWESSTDGFVSSTSITDTNPFLPVSGLTENTSFRAIVQDGSCEPDTSNVVTVTVVESPSADPGPYGDVCGGSLGLQANLSAGTGVWSLVSGPGNAIFLPSVNDPIVNVDVDQYGSYTFAWTETNGICSDDSIFTITFYEQPVADPGAGGDVCTLEFDLNATPSAGLGQWSMTAGPGTVAFLPSDTVPDALASVSQTGIYTFQWTETNGICIDNSAITVTFIEIPVAQPGTGGDICASEYQLSAVPSIGTGIWTMTGGPGTASFNPSSDVPNSMVSVDMPGTYQFTWTETNDICVDQASVEVNFLDNLLVEAGPDATVCGQQHGLNVNPQDIPGTWITVYGPGNASFSPSETDPMPRVTVDAYGAYMFKWEVRQGFCSGEDSVRISFNREPVANAGPDQVLDFRFSTYLEASLLSTDVADVNASGTWSLVSGSGLIAYPRDPGTLVSDLQLGANVFQWTIFSDFCPDVSDQVSIMVNDVESYTVITPNNDGLNDKLVFPGVEELSGCEIIIYNSWGTEVYRNADYQNNWDGRDHNDRDLIADTYYYILQIPPDRIIKSFVEIRRSK